MADSERYKKGAAKMKELFGVEPRPGMMHEDFLNITVENLFGDVWGRDGLAIQERSMITMAALTVLGRDPAYLRRLTDLQRLVDNFELNV